MNNSDDMDTSPAHEPYYEDEDESMMSPEHQAVYEATVMDSPREPTPWEEENSMLDCAMMMTRICERQRMDHFTGPTSNPNAYIFCCAYTAPTMMVSVMFLEHFGIASPEKLDYQLTHQQLLGPDKQTPLRFESVCSGINEVMGNMWSHHALYNVGIDVWLSMSSSLFESNLDLGVNMVSFVDDASNLTVHHAFIYVSLVYRDTCYIVDSWCSTDMHMRNLVKREWRTAEVVAALDIINTGVDPSEIMKRVFLDPVPDGSCNDTLRVVKLKKTVVQGLINTQFSMGSKGNSNFGGKSKAPTSKAPTSKAPTSKAALRKRKASTSKAALRKRKASTSKASTSKASSRRKNKSRRLR